MVTLDWPGKIVQMTVPELEEIVGELYLLPPADFVAARNELARQARAAGHREFAETLQHLRRPTRSAWLVNLLAHRDSAAMKRLSAVGRELRQAQTGLDGAQLRHLSEQRRQVLDELLERARHRAAEAGLRLTTEMLSEVEATLQAALVDLAGGLTVRNGRLQRPLSHAGFGPWPQVDFEWPDEVGEDVPPVEDELAARRARALATDRMVGGLVDGTGRQHVGDRSPADEAEALRQVRRAEEELAAAESVHWQREFELADAAAGLEAADDRLNWLDSQRIGARRDKVSAQANLAEAESLQRDAVIAVADARRRLDLARQLAGENEQT
jgi:hypothetical protein